MLTVLLASKYKEYNKIPRSILSGKIIKRLSLYFQRLAQDHHQSPRAAEGWFWAAESADCLGQDPQLFRMSVYQYHPESELAAEAYFRNCRLCLKKIDYDLEHNLSSEAMKLW